MCIEGYYIVMIKVHVVSLLHASPGVNSDRIRIFVFKSERVPMIYAYLLLSRMSYPNHCETTGLQFNKIYAI
jgi:hypothetical protein